MSELRAEGIVKRFPVADGELEILRGVNLELGAGESVGILGVSGSGKSTLLHIMGGLERPISISSMARPWPGIATRAWASSSSSTICSRSSTPRRTS
jgi:ABC-type nitrate/sulfonate/bicarbonate transport system ATPase subunit